jgi:hypothetical protein
MIPEIRDAIADLTAPERNNLPGIIGRMCDYLASKIDDPTRRELSKLLRRVPRPLGGELVLTHLLETHCGSDRTQESAIEKQIRESALEQLTEIRDHLYSLEAEAPTMPQEPMSREDIELLKHLKNFRPAQYLTDIEAAINISRRTLGRRLPRLIELRLVARKGKRGGIAITDSGRAFLETSLPVTAP